MIVNELMEEYGLDLSDVRWYLCSQICFKILEMQKKPDDITGYLWSGKLEAELYNIEERYIASLQDEFQRSIKSEAELRDIFAAVFAKRDRKTGYL